MTILTDPSSVLGAGLAVMGIAISIVIWLASTRAARIQEEEGKQQRPSAYLRQIDEEAYDRARRIYEAAIDQLEEELSRVQTMARDLQLEVFKLNSELARLRLRGQETKDDPHPDTGNPEPAH